MNKWKKHGETARIEKVLDEWWAWNETRGHLAVMPEDTTLSSFATLEELEAALRADGWGPE